MILRKVYKTVQFGLTGRFGPLPTPEKWVFLVGCYNSGTTLLAKLLGAHPKIGSMPREGQFYTDQLVTPISVGLPRLWATVPERFYMDENTPNTANIPRMMRQWGAHFNDHTRPVLLEKSPPNAARTRWLQKAFPNAHFIGILRNGYAVAEGIHRKEGHSLESGITQWLKSNQTMLADFEHLENKILIRYEDLTARPDKTLKDILSFLNLDTDGFSVSGQTWQIHEQTTTIKNMNPRSFKALSNAQRQEIEVIAGSLLQKLDYQIT